jgi:hypothetical protein
VSEGHGHPSRRHRRWPSFTAPAATVAAWSIFLLCDWQALHPWGAAAILDVGRAAFLASGILAPFAVGVLLYGLASRDGRSTAAVASAILGVAIVIVAFPVVRAVHRNVRQGAVARVEVRARPLVAAIDAYVRREGHPPSSLSELIPTYLPNIPRTGLAAFPHSPMGAPAFQGT